jgi:hypothetical protein
VRDFRSPKKRPAARGGRPRATMAKALSGLLRPAIRRNRRATAVH